MSVKETLAARGKHYEGPGGYADTAKTAQLLKAIFHEGRNYQLGSLSYSMMESLDMIANKLSRILNGNQHHVDSWHDIAGYATLIEKELQEAALAEISAIGQQQEKRPICDGCGNEIDPDTCGCGDSINHSAWAGHNPVAMGCDCLRNLHQSLSARAAVVRCHCGWAGPIENLTASQSCPNCGAPFKPIGDIV